jgi:CHAD domain-containing protein
LERILGHLGPLRDLHIYRRTLVRFHAGHDIERFRRYLDRQQSIEKRRIEHHLKPVAKRDLRGRFDKVDRRFQKASDTWTYAEFRASFGNVLQQQFERLAAAHRTWASSPDDKRFHGMRVELRRLRYATEFAAEVLGTLDYANIQTPLSVMRNLQTIMGDIHDLHKLRATLVAWSSHRSAKLRPARIELASQLQEKYERQMVVFNDHSRAFEGCLAALGALDRGRNSRR